jgi:hypothetical protein
MVLLRRLENLIDFQGKVAQVVKVVGFAFRLDLCSLCKGLEIVNRRLAKYARKVENVCYFIGVWYKILV